MMCNMQGQCCFQNTGLKVESLREALTFQTFLRAVCKQARMCWLIPKKMSLMVTSLAQKKRKHTDTVAQKKMEESLLKALLATLRSARQYVISMRQTQKW